MNYNDIVIHTPFSYLAPLYFLISIVIFFILVKLKGITRSKKKLSYFLVNIMIILISSIINMILFVDGKGFMLGEYIINYNNELYIRLSALFFALAYISQSPPRNF